MGMTVSLDRTKLDSLLETRTSLLLECGTRVLRVIMRVLCVEFKGMVNSVCIVLGENSRVLTVLGDAALVKLDVV